MNDSQSASTFDNVLFVRQWYAIFPTNDDATFSQLQSNLSKAIDAKFLRVAILKRNDKILHVYASFQKCVSRGRAWLFFGKSCRLVPGRYTVDDNLRRMKSMDDEQQYPCVVYGEIRRLPTFVPDPVAVVTANQTDTSLPTEADEDAYHDGFKQSGAFMSGFHMEGITTPFAESPKSVIPPTEVKMESPCKRLFGDYEFMKYCRSGRHRSLLFSKQPRCLSLKEYNKRRDHLLERRAGLIRGGAALGS